jgi:DNA helicase-2/ATP-dependent DNA helicase PcrA
MSVIEINSETIVPDFETHIKISAGPGAGKTKWLTGHIDNVLNKSERLSVSRKIACITYTNVAVETIIERLGDGIHQVEVTTIHSFLYKHVLKPYAHFLPDHYELDASKIKGHDDKIMTGYMFLQEWKKRTKQARIKDDKEVKKAFSKLRWTFDSKNELIVNTPYPFKVDKYSIKTDSYFEYKKMTWSIGIIHHDDVLFLSHELIKLFPFILDVLRAKFPYFFIDEFQDISPIQLKIINLILQRETIGCIIGDSAQSIYGFLGAKVNQFSDFEQVGIKEYEIKDNWRSTEKIVDLLNLVRSDLDQKPKRKIMGNPPVFLIGDRMAALEKVLMDTKSEDICTLTRDNIIANSIRKNSSSIPDKDMIEQLSLGDSNSERRRAIIWCTKAIEYAEQGYYKDAIKEISKIVKIDEEELCKKKSLEILKTLLSGRDKFINGSLMDLYLFITSVGIATLAKPSGKAIKELYENGTYLDLSISVNAINESLPYRTIHKSKGDEFDCVLVVLSENNKGVFDENEQLGFLLKPDMENEEHRINYVAISRAMNNLYINAPIVSESNKKLLMAKGFHFQETLKN